MNLIYLFLLIFEIGGSVLECSRLLSFSTNLVVKFIRRQANEVSHSKGGLVYVHLLGLQFNQVLKCIVPIISNEMN